MVADVMDNTKIVNSSDEQNCEQRHSSSKESRVTPRYLGFLSILLKTNVQQIPVVFVGDGMSPPSVTVCLGNMDCLGNDVKTTNRTTTYHPSD
ncbi:hypothetical protein AVEN_67600-1 [Araneus ventricosus]|uniref:Uncharacterized protein n=1 Tax=Araneus ventricosus TaxID=182803 RepID=A0A4Y2HP81_ARAVE|nr:hypothetical protein AVEN_67600-1 [Araneus ventricosus]